MEITGSKLSFEFFPPKTEDAKLNLNLVCRELSKRKPEYFSVTFGAGGGNQEKTISTVKQLTELNVNVAPHITSIGLKAEDIRNILKQYLALGINRLVVLGGDLPANQETQGDFTYANELVSFIRRETGNHFYIEVAAYPEFHPRARSAEEDLNHFKRKVECGANRAITQYFFNKDAYFHFVDRCLALGISIPIIPGIMPIRSFQQLMQFSALCDADVPLWLRKRLASYGDDVVSMQKFGTEVVTRLCEDLIRGGAPALHFYALNHTEPTNSILNNLMSVTQKKSPAFAG